MLKASAWPYPVFQEVEFQMLGALFEGTPLDHKITSKGVIVDGQRLRSLGTGTVTIRAKINTTTAQVANGVFAENGEAQIGVGFRIFCETSKFRSFQPAPGTDPHDICIPLQMVRGGVQITPVFTTVRQCRSKNGVPLEAGAIVGYSNDPVTVTIDEDWTGEIIPIRWVNFATATPPLPEEALCHVLLSGSGGVLPELWLNEKFKGELGTVINHSGLNSSQGVAGHLIRQFLWLQFWQRAVPWAIKYESEEQEQWPASRIATMWKSAFRKNAWEWPAREDINFETLEDLSAKIQHHIKQGESVAQVRRLWQL